MCEDFYFFFFFMSSILKHKRWESDIEIFSYALITNCQQVFFLLVYHKSKHVCIFVQIHTLLICCLYPFVGLYNSFSPICCLNPIKCVVKSDFGEKCCSRSNHLPLQSTFFLFYNIQAL